MSRLWNHDRPLAAIHSHSTTNIFSIVRHHRRSHSYTAAFKASFTSIKNLSRHEYIVYAEQLRENSSCSCSGSISISTTPSARLEAGRAAQKGLFSTFSMRFKFPNGCFACVPQGNVYMIERCVHINAAALYTVFRCKCTFMDAWSEV